MKQPEVIALAESFLSAWNSQEVERVVACYTPDVVYLDPNTRGAVVGSAAMRRYLTKLFANWQMTWSLREAFPFAEIEGAGVLWRATFRRGDAREVSIDGMDFVHVEGGLIRRNEVYFDRTPLMALAG